MGALAFFPLLGLVAGALITHLASQEAKKGAKYIRLLQHLLFAALITTFLWSYISYPAALLGICILIIFWKLSVKHTALIPATALLALQPTTRLPLFLYFIPSGALYKTKEIITAIIISTVLLTIFLI